VFGIQKKSFCLGTKSKCENGDAGLLPKTVILENDLLLVFRNSLLFGYSKCENDDAGLPPKTVILENDLLLVFRNSLLFGYSKCENDDAGLSPPKTVKFEIDLLLAFQKRLFVWVPKASVKMTTRAFRQKPSYWKMTCLWYSKRRRFCLDTKSECENDDAGLPLKTSY